MKLMYSIPMNMWANKTHACIHSMNMLYVIWLFSLMCVLHNTMFCFPFIWNLVAPVALKKVFCDQTTAQQSALALVLCKKSNLFDILLQTKLLKLLKTQNHHFLIRINTALYQLWPSIYITQKVKSSQIILLGITSIVCISSTSGKTDSGLHTMKRLSNLSWTWRQSWRPLGASLWLWKNVHFSL